MERQKARRGRPKKGQELGERVQLSLRVTPGLKEKLDQAAAQSGRSLSQETELQIERAFERQGLVQDTLESIYGPEIAALTQAMATAAHQVRVGIRFHNRSHGAPAGDSLGDARTYDEISKAIVAVLDGLRPEGKPEPLLVEQMLGRPIVDGATSAREYMADLLAGAFRKQQWVADTLSGLTSKGKDAP